MSITSPACCYHIEPLSRNQLSSRLGFAVREHYGLNPFSFDDSRTTLLEKLLVNGQQDSSQTLQNSNHNFAQ